MPLERFAHSLMTCKNWPTNSVVFLRLYLFSVLSGPCSRDRHLAVKHDDTMPKQSRSPMTLSLVLTSILGLALPLSVSIGDTGNTEANSTAGTATGSRLQFFFKNYRQSSTRTLPP